VAPQPVFAETASSSDRQQAPVPRPAFTESFAPPPVEEEITEPDDGISIGPIDHPIEQSAVQAAETEDAIHTPPSFATRPANEEAEPDQPSSSKYEDDYSHFDHQPPFRPRRNRLKLLTVAAAIFAVVALGAVAAASYWGLPDWAPISRPTFAQAQPDLVLDFPAEKQDRRTLPNGTEFFGASGTVTNVGKTTQTVPSILIVLRDARDRIVYSWEVAPPKRSLAPGETITINEAVTDVPRSAKFAEIGWKPE
jgi:hypothetical protein